MAGLTRKDFAAIAAAVNRARVSGPDQEEVYGTFTSGVVAGRLDWLAKELADALADANGEFDRRRFLEACGVDVDKLDSPTADLTDKNEAAQRLLIERYQL